jgi:hypothetical protein
METLVCKNTAGGVKDHREVMMIHASASVSVPYLDFSKNAIGMAVQLERIKPSFLELNATRLVN